MEDDQSGLIPISERLLVHEDSASPPPHDKDDTHDVAGEFIDRSARVKLFPNPDFCLPPLCPIRSGLDKQQLAGAPFTPPHSM